MIKQVIVFFFLAFATMQSTNLLSQDFYSNESEFYLNDGTLVQRNIGETVSIANIIGDVVRWNIDTNELKIAIHAAYSTLCILRNEDISIPSIHNLAVNVDCVSFRWGSPNGSVGSFFTIRGANGEVLFTPPPVGPGEEEVEQEMSMILLRFGLNAAIKRLSLSLAWEAYLNHRQIVSA